MAAVRAAKGQAKQPETLGESAPVDGEQVAPATPEAGAQSQGDVVPRQLDTEAYGALAQALLGNMAVTAAFERVRSRLRREWEDTDPLERDKRESLYYDMRALRLLGRELQVLVNEGKSVRRRAEFMRIA